MARCSEVAEEGWGGCTGADSLSPVGHRYLRRRQSRVRFTPRGDRAERDERDGERFHREQGFHRSSSLALLFLFAPDVLTVNQADRGMV